MLRVGADDLGYRAVGVHMVNAVLRIVLDDEDGRGRPVARMGNRLDNAAQCQVVIGDIGFGREAARACARRMVIGQAQQFHRR